MMRALLPWLLVTAMLATAAMAAPPTPMSTPPNPFVDKGACPFECCTYRDWTTNKPVMLLDKPGGKPLGISVPAKTVVRGLTGQVISVPIRLVAARDYPDAHIRKGQIFYALHYSGESFWRVWINGKVTDAEFDLTEVKEDKSKWWVQIKTKDGKTGWVLDDSQFDNQDSCG